MPAAGDHWRFALAALGELYGNVAVNRFARPETLGTQGPDPFYFYGLVPWLPRRRAAESHAFADWYHEASPEDVFVPLAKGAFGLSEDKAGSHWKGATKAEGYETERSLSFAFLKGLLLHYILDRSVHPWVYWRSGFRAENETDSIQGARHARFESALASLEVIKQISECFAILGPLAPNPREMFRADPAWLHAADALFTASFPTRYVPGMYPKAFRDMQIILSFLWDPGLRKRRILDAVGARESLLRAMIQPVTENERGTIDFSNIAQAAWRVPATGETKHSSVAELTREALADANSGLILLSAIEFGDIVPEDADFRALLGTVNHEGCPDGKKMEYSNSIYTR